MGTPLDLTAGIVGITAFAAFAAQLTSAIVKIKRFVDDVKDAPEELQDVIGQVENFGRIMSSLDVEPTQHCEDDADAYRAFTSSMDLCRQAVERISRLALQLEEDIAKGRLRGAIHAVYRKKTLEAMLRKLDRSKFDLHIAHSSYEAACQRRALREMQRLLEGNGSRAVLIQDDSPIETLPVVGFVGKAKGCEIVDSPKQCERNQMKARISLPWWICQYVWEAALSRGNGRWNFTFTTYRLLDSEMLNHVAILLVCRHDNKIRDMLSSRRLGLHDRKSDGLTLFQMALRMGRLDLARSLASSGADTACSWWVEEDHPLDKIALFAYRNFWFDQPMDEIQLQAQYMLESCDLTDETQLQNIMTPPSRRTTEERFEVALILHNGGLNRRHCEELYTLLGREQIDPILWSMCDHFGHTVLHFLASDWDWPNCLTHGTNSLVLSIIKQAHKAGADFHVVTDLLPVSVGMTPFMALLNGCSVHYSAAAQAWLSILEEAGVSMEVYLATELPLWYGHTYRPLFSGANGLLSVIWDLKTSSCKLYWRNHLDLHAAEFWTAIEEPERRVPGAWIEEEERYSLHTPALPRWHRNDGRHWGIRRKLIRKLERAVKQQRSPSDISAFAALKQVVRDIAKSIGGNGDVLLEPHRAYMDRLEELVHGLRWKYWAELIA